MHEVLRQGIIEPIAFLVYAFSCSRARSASDPCGDSFIYSLKNKIY